MSILPERTERFEAFVAPARARPALWRLARRRRPRRRRLARRGRSSSCRSPPALAGATRARSSSSPTSRASPASPSAPPPPRGCLQRRGPATLLGPGGFRPRHFALGVAAVALLGALSAPLLPGSRPQSARCPLAAWAAWLPLALPPLLVQTAAEEIAFRGYLHAGPRRPLPLAAGSGPPPALVFGAAALEPGRVRRQRLARRPLHHRHRPRPRRRHRPDRQPLRRHRPPLRQQRRLAPRRGAPLAARRPQPLPRRIDPADPAAVRPLLLADLATTLAAWAAWLAVCAPAPAIAFARSAVLSRRTIAAEGAAGRRMNWISNYVRPKINSLFSRREVPENLWVKCDNCGTMLFHRELADNLNVCTNCGHHMAITPARALHRAVRRRRLRRGAGAEAPHRPARLQATRRNTPTACATRAGRPARRRRCSSPRARSAGSRSSAPARTSPSWPAPWACTSATPSSPPPSAR